MPRAITRYKRAPKINSEATEGHYNLALALWKSDRPDDARRARCRAYKVDQNFREGAERGPQSKDLRAALSR